MAVAWLAFGTAIISRTETALLTGTATISDFPTVKITGTGTIDRRSVAAWGAQVRRTATRVILGEEAEDLQRISGVVNVNLDEHGLIETASFTVTDPRGTFIALSLISEPLDDLYSPTKLNLFLSLNSCATTRVESYNS